MADLTLSFVSNFNERVEPLMNGTVKADGIEIIPTYSHPSETFWRQLKFQEFQVAEMSMSSFLIARSRGADMIALPVFPSRRFFHAEQSYHVDSGIKEPGDLNGKRIGVGEYQQTAALWARGVLEHDFGVSQYKVHWYMERTDELSHGGATGFTPPPGISFHRIPPDKSMATMLVNHEIDVAPIASHLSRAVNVIDRSTHIRGCEVIGPKSNRCFPMRSAKPSASSPPTALSPSTTPTSSAATSTASKPGIAVKLYEAFSAAKEQMARNSFGAYPGGSPIRSGISRDDPIDSRRRSVSLRTESQPSDARHDHQLLSRARFDAAQNEDRRIIRRRNPGDVS